MASREYSERLGVITNEQLQAALDRFDLGRLVGAEPIPSGLFGQNLMIATTTGDYVFRGAPHWNPAGEDDWQFQKERFFSRLMHESPNGPLVAWPYLLEEDREIFGWGFAFQPKLPGGPLQQPMKRHYSVADVQQQWLELGRALAAVHTVSLPASGVHDPRTDSIQPHSDRYADHMERTLEQWLEMSVAASSATSDSDVEWARSLIAEARNAMRMPFQPVVVHLDYGFHNVLFEQRDGEWVLTGVVDWMTAESGHPESDLARPLATDLQYRMGGIQAFFEGYRAMHPEMPGFRERFPVFMLWERLQLWQYWQARGEKFKEGLGMREWIEPYVRMLD